MDPHGDWKTLTGCRGNTSLFDFYRETQARKTASTNDFIKMPTLVPILMLWTVFSELLGFCFSLFFHFCAMC